MAGVLSARARYGRLVICAVIAGSGLAAPVGPAVAAEIFGSKSSKVYHVRECGSARRVAASNRVRFNSPADAELAGRRLCKTCAGLIAREGQPRQPSQTGTGVPVGPAQGPPVPSAPSPVDVSRSTTSRPAGEPSTLLEVRVRKVLPGGTLELDGHDKAQLSGVSFPEEGQPGDREAVRLLRDLTRGRILQIAALADKSGNPARDAFGRQLLVRAANSAGDDLAMELLASGCAWVDRSANCERREEYLRAEDKAWWAGRGIWKRLEGPDGMREVVIGRNAQHYHPPDCPHESRLIEPGRVALNEAKGRRLTPCEYYRDRRISSTPQP